MSQNLQNRQNFKKEVGKAANWPAFLRQPGWVPHTPKNCSMGFVSFVKKTIL